LREDAKGVEAYREKMNALGSEESRLLEDSGILQRLLNLHTGRLEDARSIVGDYSPEPLDKDYKISKSEYRR
jgi:hypothetical protein